MKFEKISYVSYAANVLLLAVVIFLITDKKNQGIEKTDIGALKSTSKIVIAEPIPAIYAISKMDQFQKNFLFKSTGYSSTKDSSRYITIHRIEALEKYITIYDGIIKNQEAINKKLPLPRYGGQVVWRVGFYMTTDGAKHSFCVAPVICEVINPGPHEKVIHVYDFADPKQENYLYTYHRNNSSLKAGGDDTSIYDMGQVWP